MLDSMSVRRFSGGTTGGGGCCCWLVDGDSRC